MSDQPTKSKRERERAAMLEEALARPGVREVMEVYQHWQKADRAMEPYRMAARQHETVTTSDRSSRAFITRQIIHPT